MTDYAAPLGGEIPSKMSLFREIETAPDDGRVVYVRGEDVRLATPVVKKARWVYINKREGHGGWVVTNSEDETKFEWLEIFRPGLKITHWAPLLSDVLNQKDDSVIDKEEDNE